MTRHVETVVDDLAQLINDDNAPLFGIYLHGSQARNEARPDSDIDILVLTAAGVGEEEQQEFKDHCLQAVGDASERLDLKVVPAPVFIENPWVDLTKARWLAGRQWHQEFSPRSLDEAAHESLTVLRVLIEDDAFAQPSVAEIRKPLGRLCSVLASLVGRTAPSSAGEAIEILRGCRDDATVQQVLGVMAEVDPSVSTSVDPGLASRVQLAVQAVLKLLRHQLTDAELGPRCAEAARGVLAARPWTTPPP